MEFAKRASVDGKVLDVVTHEMYENNKELYANTSTGLEVENIHNGKNYILPYRNQTDDRPGIYDEGSIYFMKFPQPEEDHVYASDSFPVVDYNNATTMEEFLTAQKQLRDIESEILTDIDNVFSPPINSDDNTEMVILKEAISAKQCDINKYSQRFANNFLNDKRILKGGRISMDKFISVCNNLDIKAEIILSDKDSNVPNPMGKEFRATITGGGPENDE